MHSSPLYAAPLANAVLHTTCRCARGVPWLFSSDGLQGRDAMAMVRALYGESTQCLQTRYLVKVMQIVARDTLR